MDWSQILYAGIGGGAGAALGSLIAIATNKRVQNKKYHSGIVAAFAVTLSLLGAEFVKSQYGNMKLPRLGSSVEKQLLGISPLYVEMKKYEPDYFERILAQMDASSRKGTDETTMINEGRSVLIELLVDKAQYADGETLTTMMEITRQNYLDYKLKKPYLCVLMINQRDMGDVAPYLSAKSSELEEEYTLKMIQLPRNEIMVVDMEMAKKSEKSTIAEAVKTIQPGDVLDLPADAPEEKLKRVCDLGVVTMDVILALPEPERANYIRSTLGQ